MSEGEDGRLVGRERELTRLFELTRLVAEGRGGLGWVRGEPGIGTSALVDAVVAKAGEAGCVVYRAAGDELTQAFPLRLMADAFGVSARTDDPAKEAINRLLRGESTGAADPVLAAGERLLELVDRLCTAGPVVLVGEDLQFADEPSLLLWNRLARAVDQIPLLLVGTDRPVPYRATVARLHDLARERHGELVELGPLGDDDVRLLAERILGEAPGPRLRHELARAGGNPLYVRELVDALTRDGLVEDGEFHGESGAVPDSLAVAIGGRFRFPSASTADVLRIAALLGPDFGVDELVIATDRSVAELSVVVEEAIAVGAVTTAGSRLMFRHPVIRQVLVGQASAATVESLHSHLAKELAAAGRPVDVVARHLLAAPHSADRWVAEWLAEVPEALLYAVPQVAVELLLRVTGTHSPDDPLWPVLAARAAQVLYWLGRDEAGRLAAEVVRHTDDVTLAATMTILRMRFAGRSGHVEEALGLAGAPIDDDVPAYLRARLTAWSAINFGAFGQVERAAATAEAALAEATRSGDRLALGYALHASTLAADAPTAVNRIDRALSELGDDPASMDLRLLLTNNRLTYLAQLGSWTEVEAALPQVLVLAERVGTFRAAILLATAAEVGYMHGTWDDALVHLDGINAEFRTNRTNLNPPAVGALIALHRGDRETADTWLESAGTDFAELTRLPTNWRLAAAWSLAAEIDGEPRQALDRLSILLEQGHVPGQRTRQELMPHLVRLALSVGDWDLAETAVAMCQADADANPQADRIAAARCCQALRDGDAEGLMAAAQRYGEYGWPLQKALAQEEAAVVLAQDGDPGRARTAFTDALNIYNLLGAAWDLRRVEARLRPFGIRRGPRSLRRRATSGWEALTPAETRVARLVARGMSNPDIAAELFLSRRTVQTHVSNILAKLQLRSRVEIMRQAVGQ